MPTKVHNTPNIGDDFHIDPASIHVFKIIQTRGGYRRVNGAARLRIESN